MNRRKWEKTKNSHSELQRMGLYWPFHIFGKRRGRGYTKTRIKKGRGSKGRKRR